MTSAFNTAGAIRTCTLGQLSNASGIIAFNIMGETEICFFLGYLLVWYNHWQSSFQLSVESNMRLL